jgi:hypothetical protein
VGGKNQACDNRHKLGTVNLHLVKDFLPMAAGESKAFDREEKT